MLSRLVLLLCVGRKLVAGEAAVTGFGIRQKLFSPIFSKVLENKE